MTSDAFFMIASILTPVNKDKYSESNVFFLQYSIIISCLNYFFPLLPFIIIIIITDITCYYGLYYFSCCFGCLTELFSFGDK